MPELRRRSLDAVAGALGIGCAGRHRALPDARIAAEILTVFLERAAGRGIARLDQLLDFQRSAVDGRPFVVHVPRERLTQAPATPGVYHLLDREGRLLYVGKALRLRERLASYFTNARGHSARVLDLLRHMHDFRTTETATRRHARTRRRTGGRSTPSSPAATAATPACWSRSPPGATGSPPHSASRRPPACSAISTYSRRCGGAGGRFPGWSRGRTSSSCCRPRRATRRTSTRSSVAGSRSRRASRRRQTWPWRSPSCASASPATRTRRCGARRWTARPSWPHGCATGRRTTASSSRSTAPTPFSRGSTSWW